MSLLAIDLGGTKLATALFTKEGDLISSEKLSLDKRQGSEVARLILTAIQKFLDSSSHKNIKSIGVSVPGIFQRHDGTVWAPNIPGWERYPLLAELQSIAQNIPVTIESDRSCYILGEQWKGAATDCTDAIYLAVGTGIGAGILTGGKILHGASDIAGAIGWMALERPFQKEYTECGCFEGNASGEGIAKMAKKVLQKDRACNGIWRNKSLETITSIDLFDAYDEGDKVARGVLEQCIEYWGMAVANLVSLFNPQKIIFGGGVFGPAVKFIPAIYEEARKWAQPLSMKQVKLEASLLGANAGLFGAACLANKNLETITRTYEK